MASLGRHSEQTEGKLFKIIEGKNFKDFKIIDVQKGDVLTNNSINELIKQGDPRFTEYVEKQKIIDDYKKQPYINPVTKKTTTFYKALQDATGLKIPLHTDHVEGVAKSPLKNLDILLANTNTGKPAARTPAE